VEAEIRKITVQGQPRHFNNNNKKTGMVAHTCYSSYLGGTSKKIKIQASLGRNVRPHLKNNESKKGWGSGSSDRAFHLASTRPSIQSISTTKKECKWRQR
jgi:hypothetical protein